MTTHTNVPPLMHITDPDFAAGYEEAQEPYYADCSIRTDIGLVDVVRATLTEVAVERGLSEQQLRRSTGFIIGILSRG
jgi:hypothetical protein